MKKILLFIVVLFIASFTTLNESSEFRNQSDGFNWLLGSWERVNDPIGNQTFEYWKKSADDVYKGMACTLKEGDTIWQEKIKLHRPGQDWQFEVVVQNESKPTVFKITEIGKSSFTCENPENEYPKKIEYKLVESGLKASISGGGKKVDFDFKKVE